MVTRKRFIVNAQITYWHAQVPFSSLHCAHTYTSQVFPAAPTWVVHRQQSQVMLMAPTSWSATATVKHGMRRCNPTVSASQWLTGQCHHTAGKPFQRCQCRWSAGHLLSQTQHPLSADCGWICIDLQCEREGAEEGCLNYVTQRLGAVRHKRLSWQSKHG